MRSTGWIPSVMDVDRKPLEFTGDDVDQFTSVIDLKGNYEFVTVIVPVIVSGTIIPYIQRTPAVSEVPAIMHILDADGAGSFAQTTANISTVITAVTFRIGGAQYLRLRTSGNQTSDVTFYLKGFNRENM